jgi:hypothetical protein
MQAKKITANFLSANKREMRAKTAIDAINMIESNLVVQQKIFSRLNCAAGVPVKQKRDRSGTKAGQRRMQAK